MQWSYIELVLAGASVAGLLTSIVSLVLYWRDAQKQVQAASQQHKHRFIVVPGDADHAVSLVHGNLPTPTGTLLVTHRKGPNSASEGEVRVIDVDTTDEDSVLEFISSLKEALAVGSRRPA
jgi:hypothetical protein